jgi:hypothetical protein
MVFRARVKLLVRASALGVAAAAAVSTTVPTPASADVDRAMLRAHRAKVRIESKHLSAMLRRVRAADRREADRFAMIVDNESSRNKAEMRAERARNRMLIRNAR